MAVSRPPSRSPPPPPDQCEANPPAETDKTSETSETSETETDDTEQTQPQPPGLEKEEENGETKRRRPKWLCSLLTKRAPREKKMKKTFWQRSIMGKISGWFKKSDDKLDSPSASNPYAQQQPVGQAAPPPQYGQHSEYNSQQYNDNQYLSQPSQGPPSGLPTGPRPGGLPSRVAPGPPRTGPFVSNKASGTEKSPPPQYSPHGAQPPPYGRGSPSLSSAGGTPVIPSNTSSPSMGTGFPKEKYGAQDAVGRNRFEPAPSPYGNPTPPSSQRQGGYGNLDDSRGALFASYNSAPQPTTGPGLAQADTSQFEDGGYSERPEMTEQEREEAEVGNLKAQIEREQIGTEESLDRSLRLAHEGEERLNAIINNFDEQERRLDGVEYNLQNTHMLNSKAKDHTSQLKHYNRGLFRPGYNSSKQDQLAAQWAEKELAHQRKQEEIRSEQQERRQGLQNSYEENSRKVLGAKKLGQADHSKFMFEDDDGQQQERMVRTDDKMDQLLAFTGRLKIGAQVLNDMTDSSIDRLRRMDESAERAREGVVKNHAAMKRAAGMDH